MDTGATKRVRPRALSIPAVVVVIGYAGLLLLIPPQLVVAGLGGAGNPATLWAVAGLIWWIFATLSGQNPVKGWTALRIALGLLTVAVLLSYAWSMSRGWYAPLDARQWFDEVWTTSFVQPEQVAARTMASADRGLLTFAGWCGVVLLTAEGVRGRRDLDLLITWISIFATVVATIGIIQYFTGFNLAALISIPGLSASLEYGTGLERSGLVRVSATTSHAIEFGVLMATVFWLALHRSLTLRRLRSWIPTLLIGLAVPFAVARTPIIALAVAAMIMLFGWHGRRRFWAIVLAPVAAVAIRVAAPGLVGTLLAAFLWVGSDPSIAGRTEDYQPVLDLLAYSPVLGRGLFTFLPQFYRIFDNQLLLSLIELGIVGLIALLGFFATGFFLARRSFKAAKDEDLRHLGLTISAALAGLVICYGTFDALSFSMAAGMSFLLVGMAASLWRLTGAPVEPAGDAEQPQPVAGLQAERP